jgi:signal transduction histidine kinase
MKKNWTALEVNNQMTQNPLFRKESDCSRALMEADPSANGHADINTIPSISSGDTRRGAEPGDAGPGVIRIYHDKDGLPVTYDAATHKKMEQVKSDAISVLSHELLSPLTLIKGYTATLLELKNDITEEQEEKYLRGIETASNRLVRLLENLRDITCLEETNNLVAQPVNIYDLLRTVAAEQQSQTTRHIINLDPAARLPRVRIDPEKIVQVLNNLLANAIKYSPRGGDIEISVHQVQSETDLDRLPGEAPDINVPALVVSVADSGDGIPEAELELIFEKFYRVSGETTRGVSGAGLGLYICKMIVEAHGGCIWAGNGERGGAVFNFSLPLERPR